MRISDGSSDWCSSDLEKTGRRDRLSGAHQGGVGRRRPRHEGRARRGEPRKPDGSGGERSGRGFRRFDRLYGEISRQPAPYRISGVRRRQRHRHPPRLARLLSSAPPPPCSRRIPLPPPPLLSPPPPCQIRLASSLSR